MLLPKLLCRSLVKVRYFVSFCLAISVLPCFAGADEPKAKDAGTPQSEEAEHHHHHDDDDHEVARPLPIVSLTQAQQILESGTEAEKIFAVRQFRAQEKGKEEERLLILEKALKDSNAEVRRVAAYCIGVALAGKAVHMPVLEAMLNDADEQVRIRAAQALVRIEFLTDSQKAVCVYAANLTFRVKLEMSEKTIHDYGYLAASLLENYGNLHPDLIHPALALCTNKQAITASIDKALAHEKVQERLIAVKVAGWTPELAQPLRPRLLEMLEKEEHPVMRSELIYTLSEKPLYTAAVGEAIATHRTQPYFEERVAAYAALSLLPPDKAIPILLTGLKDGHEEVRVCAILTLGSFGLKAADTVKVLIAVLNDDTKQPRERGSAAQGLLLIGTPEAKQVVAELQKKLEAEGQIPKGKFSGLGR